MAEIKKITRSAPISNFNQAAPEAGGAFRFLAGAMEDGYNFLLPAAKAEMTARGEEAGREMARRQVGNPSATVTMSSMGGADTAPQDPSFDWSSHVTEGGARPDAITGMHAQFRTGLQSMLSAAPAGIKENLKIGSGYRSNDRQAELWAGALKKYGSPEAARKWVAPPGNSQHNHGNAADLKFGSPEAKKWAHDNAAQFGLAFPLSNEDWHIEDATARGGPRDAAITMSTSGAEYTPPTVIRDANGDLASRLYSPLAGPLLQVSNAAAGVAYQSDVMLKGMTDILDMSNHFTNNPEGFQQATQAYVEDLVSAAPDMFKSDIRAGIEKVAQQRFLGIMEEKQRDTRQRADNSSRALADRWSDNLAQAVATGNPDQIAAAEAELSSILHVRETLPGIAWTPEQSQNVMIKAHESGQALIKKASDDQAKQDKAALSLITKSALDGRTAADESILQDPRVQAWFPDQVREAASSVMLRDQMPSFMQMTPAEQQQALGEMKSQPITADWELGLYNAAEKSAAANAAAWEKDPIKRAGEVLQKKPPALPTAQEVMQDPQTLSDAIAARVAYGNGLKDQGFVDFPAFFTDEEAATYGAVLGKETPPEIKAMVAGSIVAAAGQDAPAVFKELKSDDPVTLLSGQLMARSGDTVVPLLAMKGQAMLDQGVVQPPTKATTLEAISPDIKTALSILPGSEKIRGDTMAMATAIYAASVPPNGVSDSAEKTLMEQSVQKALGQGENRRGEKTGGVQKIGGAPVLLPPGMSGPALTKAIEGALGRPMDFGEQIAPIFGLPAPAAPENWLAAGATSEPMLEGKPLTGAALSRMQLTPLGGNMYSMALRSAAGGVTDVRDSKGGLFIFDAKKMVEAKDAPLFVAGKPDGLLSPGNIDLKKRPIVQNADGSISTVKSMSFEEDGVEVLIPRVSPSGAILTEEGAIKLYEKTGAYLGKFTSPDAATAYANSLHDQQDMFYKNKKPPAQPNTMPNSISDLGAAP